jgi:large subunit ribosomal protein L25
MSKSKTLTVDIKVRTEAGTSAARRMRRAGTIPAVLYGHGAPVQSLAVSEETAKAVLHHPGLMSLALDGAESATAILKSSQRHAVSGQILHLDFLAVRADEVIRATVPLDYHGIPMGASKGGQLEQILHLLEIECLPGDLPESVVVDVSGLDLDATMHVRDLTMPEGIKAASDGALAVFQVRLPKIEEVKEEKPEGEAAAPEAAEGAEGAEAGKAAEGAEAAKPEKGGKPEKADKKAEKK